MAYGAKIERGPYNQLADVIGSIERTPAGNVLLRIGRENEPQGSWHQAAHVVLMPDEARDIVRQITEALAAGR